MAQAIFFSKKCQWIARAIFIYKKYTNIRKWYECHRMARAIFFLRNVMDGRSYFLLKEMLCVCVGNVPKRAPHISWARCRNVLIFSVYFGLLAQFFLRHVNFCSFTHWNTLLIARIISMSSNVSKYYSIYIISSISCKKFIPLFGIRLPHIQGRP